MKKISVLLTLMFTAIFLSGCLYPEERKAKNSAPYQNQLNEVQAAVDEFREATGGLLPIKTKDMSVPIYQKYPIDFNRLSPRYLAEPPGTSYENGGEYLYVLVDVEKNPTVKLIDVKMSEAIRDLKLRVEMYKEQHKYPPYEKVVAKNLFMLDYQKLGLKEAPSVTSPLTGTSLPLLVDQKGDIQVDYRVDLAKLAKQSKTALKPGEEIQDLMWKETPFVPAFSVQYTVNDKQEPVFLP
ncbi:hypothetical protein P9D34_08695 [Bacillus swezeyi]|uniref:ABC transporter periplasmic binding protein yphF n=1 Tax=Bacillus swezeyi TaxID=1925020 RepID=A0A1R1S2J3_9BACI|nr:hypothetical protein [Bacillus swezeyi]MEC1260520.1 hypothetical protein [Bacillus swezeyi]MED2929623.1 hypothetical protein [Bacillus swezeyi]MED2943628.1 hypothetical protein [Bacillus swezeyi]MED2963350.1 hypothetical protein [Bacillus swezeyi]MED2979170.1 hypothetical protein [Bacillus swezeyi]